MHVLTKHLHRGLQNCFEGTKSEKLLVLSEDAKGKEREKSPSNEIKSRGDSTNLITSIMKITSFTLAAKAKSKNKSAAKTKSGSKKKQNDALLKVEEDVITPIEINRILPKP